MCMISHLCVYSVVRNSAYFQMLYHENAIQIDTMEIHYHVWKWDGQRNINHVQCSKPFGPETSVAKRRK